MRPLFAGGTGGQTIKESQGWARLSLPADWTLADWWTCETEESRMDRILDCGAPDLKETTKNREEKFFFSDCDSPSNRTNSLWPVHLKSGTPPRKTTTFRHTALCHSFTSGLTLSSTEPGKRPEVVKMGAGDISQLSEHAQSLFSSLTLQPGQGVYLMAKTLSRTHHNSDCVGVFLFFPNMSDCVRPATQTHT